MVAEASDPKLALAEFVERLTQEPLLLKAYTAQAIVSMQVGGGREREGANLHLACLVFA
jgi:hypothetical protein